MSETRAEATPKEWLGIGRDVGQLANKWSLREDLVAYVGRVLVVLRLRATTQ